MKLRHFNVQLALRMTGMFLSLLLLAFGVAYGLRILLLSALVIIVVVQVASMIRFINHTNHELESFLAGMKFGDFQQTYTIAHLGPSFAALENSLKIAVEKFKSLRLAKEQQAVYNQTLVQHIPTPFFVVHSDGRLEILNNATRRAFNVPDITNTNELADFGAGFQRDVMQIKPGEEILTTIELAGTDEYFLMTATQLSSKGQQQKLVSLQNIQSELDATELATWQNLLRVTSHEILNSLAPVSSCAQSARALVTDIIEGEIEDQDLQEDMRDIQASMDTVLRRSEGLTRFIQSYRQLSRMPPPKKSKINVSKYFQHLDALVRDELEKKNIEISFAYDPPSLALQADEDMLDQMLINLIRNAADESDGINRASIWVSAYKDRKLRTVIEVKDNGPGIREDIAEKIFVPFFTTKAQGSGIGLALVRYIMLSHGGTATYTPNDLQGSSFRLVF
jgi:nitrogen fixation/metabolism regulation signal transduction histidine kinase